MTAALASALADAVARQVGCQLALKLFQNRWLVNIVDLVAATLLLRVAKLGLHLWRRHAVVARFEGVAAFDRDRHPSHDTVHDTLGPCHACIRCGDPAKQNRDNGE